MKSGLVFLVCVVLRACIRQLQWMATPLPGRFLYGGALYTRESSGVFRNVHGIAVEQENVLAMLQMAWQRQREDDAFGRD